MTQLHRTDSNLKRESLAQVSQQIVSKENPFYMYGNHAN
jgi:hypothetical protein